MSATTAATPAIVVVGSGNAAMGLLAAGELVGGLFAGNHPGGSGLAAGTVFGRRAGRTAAATAAPLLRPRPHPIHGGPR